MRRILIAAVVIALCAIGLGSCAKSKTKLEPKPANLWPKVLLSEPFHIGDQEQVNMQQVKPMGNQILKRFEIEGNTPSLDVGVLFSSTVGPDHEDFKKGHYYLKLFINGKEIDVLNRHLPPDRNMDEPHMVTVRLDSKDVQIGQNELVIRGEAKDGNIAECEISKIVLSLNSP